MQSQKVQQKESVMFPCERVKGCEKCGGGSSSINNLFIRKAAIPLNGRRKKRYENYNWMGGNECPQKKERISDFIS